VDLIVEDLEQLRRHWDSDSIVLIGHSFGSVIALEYAAKYPQRVSRLILSGAAPDVPAALDLQCARLERLHPDIYAQAVARLPQGSQRRCNVFAAPRSFIDGAMYPDPETMRLVDETDASGGMRNTGEIGRALFASGFLDYRFTGHERLAMPMLVIQGASDFQAVVEPQRALVSRVPGARLIEYDGRGHFMFVEEPERFARDVTEFVRGSPRR
jgi:proline iminopeptidase